MSEQHRDPTERDQPDTTSAEDRRQHGRYLAQGDAMLTWQGPSTHRSILIGTVKNVSAEGMAILLEQPVAVGQVVWLKMDRATYTALIRSCQPEGNGFLAGLYIMLSDAGVKQDDPPSDTISLFS